MRRKAQFLPAAVMAIFMQACTSIEYVAPENIDQSDVIIVTTKGGNEFRLKEWRRNSSGSLWGIGSEKPIPADSIATIGVSRTKFGTTAIAVAGAAAGVYGFVSLVDVLRRVSPYPFWQPGN